LLPQTYLVEECSERELIRLSDFRTGKITMKTGLFCNYENHGNDTHRAIFEQVALVKHVESLGFESAWVTEHHFNDFSVSPSILVLMAHLAGMTSKIRLGSAAVFKKL
jgi:hypothetical protein